MFYITNTVLLLTYLIKIAPSSFSLFDSPSINNLLYLIDQIRYDINEEGEIKMEIKHSLSDINHTYLKKFSIPKLFELIIKLIEEGTLDFLVFKEQSYPKTKLRFFLAYNNSIIIFKFSKQDYKLLSISLESVNFVEFGFRQLSNDIPKVIGSEKEFNFFEKFNNIIKRYRVKETDEIKNHKHMLFSKLKKIFIKTNNFLENGQFKDKNPSVSLNLYGFDKSILDAGKILNDEYFMINLSPQLIVDPTNQSEAPLNIPNETDNLKFKIQMPDKASDTVKATSEIVKSEIINKNSEEEIDAANILVSLKYSNNRKRGVNPSNESLYNNKKRKIDKIIAD